jgi:hypothetical protein
MSKSTNTGVYFDWKTVIRGVDKTMIKVFEQYEKKDDMNKTQGVKTLLHEFSDEMGVKNFILLILMGWWILVNFIPRLC